MDMRTELPLHLKLEALICRMFKKIGNKNNDDFIMPDQSLF